MKLFPHTLVRIGGGPFDDFENLNFSLASTFPNKVLELDKEILQTKDEICDDLFLAIKISDQESQKYLLNIKRDIYNLRKLSGEKVNSLKNLLEDTLKSKIVRFNNLLLARENSILQFNEAYSNELKAKRSLLKEFSQNDNLQKGLMLSSQILYQELLKYVKTNNDKLTKKDHHLEHSIIKYLSRIYVKTSPFSTFTGLDVGKIVDLESPEEHLFSNACDQELETKSHIRISNSLFKHILTLSFNIKQIYSHFIVRINPTLRKVDRNYTFLINVDNVESFQTIPVNDFLELIKSLVEENTDSITFEALIELLNKGEYLDESKNDIENYIKLLIDAGFLEYKIGVSGIDPDWDIKFRKILNRLPANPEVQQLVALLNKLRVHANTFSVVNAGKRSVVLQNAFAEVKETCAFLKNAIESTVQPESNGENQDAVSKIPTNIEFLVKPEVLFFEDLSIKTNAYLDKYKVNLLIETMSAFIDELALFEFILKRDRMTPFFLEKYGSDASINLLSFYEHYYKEIVVPEMKNSGSNYSVDPELPLKREVLSKWSRSFSAFLKKNCMVEGDVCNINLELLQSFNISHLPQNYQKPKSLSHAIFIQLYEETGKSGRKELRGIINGINSGYGKYFSRFLHLFDDKITEEMKSWNTALSEDDVLFENSDASFFNANIHPSLMPFEILTPNSNNILSSDKQLAVIDFDVRFNTDERKLMLIHKPSGKRSYSFDLAFENLLRRSQLYQLLNEFSLFRRPNFRPVIDAVYDAFSTTGDITINPRVTLSNTIVLRRKSWVIEKKMIPIKTTVESDGDYFLKINKWRLQNEIPLALFVTVNDLYETSSKVNRPKSSENNKLSHDDYKPQYINFSNPFLVMLFEKLALKSSDTLKLVEMLPCRDNLNEINGKKYITEHLIQWYE